ncbi:MAG: methionyl-tRNA formyltransferase [Proteobacteria bacterium]|nr:methionyl-tRNA formyltransferase [Pseudomonadota bacterium]
MGTPDIACPSLQALATTPDFQVVGVVVQPDKPKGRDLKLQPPPVKELALRLGLPVLQPERARNEAFLQLLRELRPELVAVLAYGQILPQALLDIPTHGCLNVHTSLLPRWRGAAPIQWAILEGDAESGVTIMRMDAGLDTGGIVATRATPIAPEDNSQTLHDRLATLGAELLVQTIPRYVSGELPPCPQPAVGVTYARKLAKDDGRLDWSQPAQVLHHRLRAFTPWPGTFTFLPAQPKPLLLKVWRADLAPGSGQPGEVLAADKTGIVVACREGALRLLEVQKEGSRRMTAAEFLAGHPLAPGTTVG